MKRDEIILRIYRGVNGQDMFGNISSCVLPWTAVRHTSSHVIFIYKFLSADKQLTVYRRRQHLHQSRRSNLGLTIAHRSPRASCRIATHSLRWPRHVPHWPVPPPSQVNIAVSSPVQTQLVGSADHCNHLLQLVAHVTLSSAVKKRSQVK